MYEDLSKFPSGMKSLGDWVKAQGFHYGLYSCRGTCQCGTGTYHAPGSHGYEAADVDWMVAAGADYREFWRARPAKMQRAPNQPFTPTTPPTPLNTHPSSQN